MTVETWSLYMQIPREQTSEYEKLRAEIRNRRRSGFGLALLPQPEKGIKEVRKITWQDNSQADDFSEHDLEKSIPTYPVDLSRALTADNYIPAVLETTIYSEIPSEKVIAVVDKHVYATHGRNILIPKATRCIGAYEPLEQEGDERLAFIWNRCITPEGINIMLKAEGLDAQGRAGLTGEVDNRLWDRYGNAAIFATIAALPSMTIDTENESTAAGFDAFSDEFGSISADALRSSLDLTPRLEIPAGTRITISPLQDIWLKEPQRGEIQIVPLEARLNFQYSHNGQHVGE